MTRVSMDRDQVKLKEKDQVQRLWHTYLVILTRNALEKNISSMFSVISLGMSWASHGH